MVELDDTAAQVLLIAPQGRVGREIRNRIDARGWHCEWRDNLAEALASPRRNGATALVVAGEALDAMASSAFYAWLTDHEPASDPPVLLLADQVPSEREHLWQLADAGNVTVVPLPVSEITLASWLHAARRAGLRQQQAALRLRDLQQAERFGRTLGRVLGHDLRTPLAAAQLSAEVILRASRDERALRPAARVLSSAHRIQWIVDQLLDYIHLAGGGSLSLRRRETDAGEVCRRVLARVAEAEPGARLEFEEHGDPLAEWDPERIAQLVAAVLTTAARHGCPGEPVFLVLDGTAEEELRIVAESSGGIDGAVALRAFEPFHGLQAEPEEAAAVLPSYARAGEGLGLALYLARETARAHGGELALDACAEDATRFVATLPRRLPP